MGVPTYDRRKQQPPPSLFPPCVCVLGESTVSVEIDHASGAESLLK